MSSRSLIVWVPSLLCSIFDRAESQLQGVVDLVNNRGIVWKDESLGAKYEFIEIPADLADKAAEYRERLIELVVEQDDEIMEAYLEGNEPDVPTIKKLIRQAPSRAPSCR